MTAVRVISKLGALLRDGRGTMAIETAIVAPMLIVMSVGGFEVSSMVTRQSELQSSAAEAVAIVLASSPETQTEIDQIEAVVEGSSGLPEDDVDFSLQYRCGTGDLQPDTSGCADEELLTSYIIIDMTDNYEPVWTHFGFGEGLNYRVIRSVQIG